MGGTYIHLTNINSDLYYQIHKILSTKLAHIPPIPIKNDGQIIKYNIHFQKSANKIKITYLHYSKQILSLSLIKMF